MDDIVLYDSFGCLIISLKYMLVNRIEPISTANNIINGEKELKILYNTLPMGSDVFMFASFNTNNINTPTDTHIDEYASVFPITELEENDLIVMTKTVIPPAIRE
jgi:hypothetical protein